MATMLWLLFLIIGIAVTVPLATNGYGFEYMWPGWLPCWLLNFVELYYFIIRYRRLSKTIDEWNRCVGDIYESFRINFIFSTEMSDKAKVSV